MIGILNTGIDLNRRVDPLHVGWTHKIKKYSETTERVAKIALPFFSLYGPSRRLVTCGLGVAQLLMQSHQIVQDFKAHEWKKLAYDSGRFVFLVAVVAFNILLPRFGAFFSLAVQIGQEALNFGIYLLRGEFAKAARELLTFMHHTLYLLALCSTLGELTLLSLLVQASVELYQAYKDYRAQNLPECLAEVLMVALRVAGALPLIEQVYRDHYGQKMTQENWESLVQEIQENVNDPSEEELNFERLLKENFYSGKVANVNFVGVEWMKKFKFTNTTFKNCQFSSFEQEVNFSGSRFIEVKFTEVNLSEGAFYRAHLIDSMFQRCILTHVNFAESSLKRVEFRGCDLTQTAFNSAELEGVLFSLCKLAETSFLDANIREAAIKNCDLTDTLFIGTQDKFNISNSTPHKMTRPVIGMQWDFRGVGTFTYSIKKALSEAGAIPLKIDSNFRELDELELDREVESALSWFDLRGIPSGVLSRGDALLKQAKRSSQIGIMRDRAEFIGRYISGLMLPGGNDIHPQFYGATKEAVTETDDSYGHTINEFSLIAATHAQHKPIHGICRGSQVVNIFFGGTLKQHVEGQQWVYQELQVGSEANPLAAKAITQIVPEGFFKGYSAHHQASDKIGKGLHVVIEQEGVVKAMANEQGSIVLTQFHPEIYLYYKTDPLLQWLMSWILDDKKFKAWDESRLLLSRNKEFFSALVAKAGSAHAIA